MGYFGILCIRDKNIQYKYIEQLEMTLKSICPEIVRVVYEEDSLFKVREVIKQTDCSLYEGIMILKDEMFGAFYDLSALLQKMCGKYDVWGIDYDMKQSYRMGRPVLYDCFLVIERQLTKSPDFLKNLGNDGWREYLLYDRSIKRGSAVLREPDINNSRQISLWLYMPYQTIVREHIPFLMIKSFDIDKMLQYSLQHELQRTLKYLEQNGWDTDSIWEYIIAEFDIGDIKRVLHLEYPIFEQGLVKPYVNKKKAAVFAHVFYEDLYDRCISYFQKIPQEIDIYVSTKEAGRKLLEEKLKAANVAVKGVFAAGERGRDAGALLVSFAPFLELYDYICFVHDKKSSGGLFPVSEGMSFMDLVWDNLIPNQAYLYQVIELFEKNKYLGVIAPPIPYMGSYFASIVGNEWTVCFEETRKLAEKLGVSVRISEEKLPFVLSTCFWCRPKALADLFRYPWSVRDFPPEPLKLDGTVNHAIERIIPYLAQSRGYYSALAYQAEYASVYMNNLSYVADEIYKEMRNSGLIAAKFPLDLCRGIDLMKRLMAFIEEHSEIYVYGTGAQGKLMKRKLDMMGVKPAAFLVSGWKGNDKVFEGCKVHLFADVKEDISRNGGIILALSDKFADEVIPNLGTIDYFKIGAE